ncbi:ATP-binding protein [Streptomyces ziwulingensis]|uniref:Histidine kinase/HSP90-like ATPase domain-containing protein n=1 Tax=Streptomyces ziwulingensis TaxID=1045501 RepID=A0ABP9CUI8_9ACTN
MTHHPLNLTLRPLTGTAPGYTQTLLLLPESAALARRSVRTTLACWGLEELSDSAEVIVSELVTNAVLHGRPAWATAEDPGRCRLTLERPSPGVVWLTVADPSPRRPVRRTAPPDAESGRGLAVVGELAARFAVQAAKTGKAVWAELRAEP